MVLAQIIQDLGNGRYLLNTHKSGRVMGKMTFSVGDMVLTARSPYGDTLIYGHVDKSIPVIFPISGVTEQALPIIVCYTGLTTGDYNKVYYNLSKHVEQQVQEDGSTKDVVSYSISPASSPAGWDLTDDGAYGVINSVSADADDPWSFHYVVRGNGLDVPAINSGISAKLQTSKGQARFIASQTVEHEHWMPVTPSIYGVLFDTGYRLKDSLISYFYAHDNKRPSHVFYRTDDVIRFGTTWDTAQSLNSPILIERGTESSHYRDALNIIKNFHKITLPTGTSSSEKTVFSIQHLFEASGHGGISGAQACSDKGYLVLGVRKELRASSEMHLIRIKQRITSILYYPNQYHCIAEPTKIEGYDLATKELTDPGLEDVDRGLANFDDYFLHGGLTIERQDSGSNPPNPALSVDLPFSLVTGTETGNPVDKMDFVRVERKSDWSQMRSSLYVNSSLIEGSLTLWEDTVIIPNNYGYSNIIPIRKTAYSIIQTFHDANFHAALYRKTTYQSSQIVNCPVNTSSLDDPSDLNVQYVEAHQVISKTEFRIVVNGHILILSPYQTINREYQGHGSWLYTWGDVGYEFDGSQKDETNNVVMREMFSATKDILLFSFDVYPVKFRNQLKAKQHTPIVIAPQGDSSIVTYPPYTDSTYQYPTKRHWYIFRKDGLPISNLTSSTPQDNRLNGMVVLDPDDFTP